MKTFLFKKPLFSESLLKESYPEIVEMPCTYYFPHLFLKLQ